MDNLVFASKIYGSYNNLKMSFCAHIFSAFGFYLKF